MSKARYPWSAALEDGTVIVEEAGRDYRALWQTPLVRRFVFATPIGEIGVNHATGLFLVGATIHKHPLYRVGLGGAYMHWHRFGMFSDGSKGGVADYSVGMERPLGDGHREILFLWFPHNLTDIRDVKRCTRICGANGRQENKSVALMEVT